MSLEELQNNILEVATTAYDKGIEDFRTTLVVLFEDMQKNGSEFISIKEFLVHLKSIKLPLEEIFNDRPTDK